MTVSKTEPVTTTAAFGAWESPLSATAVSAAGRTIVDLLALPAASPFDLAWIEARPDEGGRQVIVARRGDSDYELPAPYSARSRVHEYGGGAAIGIGNAFVFSDFRSQRLHWFHPDTANVADLADVPAHRFADFALDATRNRLIAVCERHGASAVDNLLVTVDLATGSVHTLVDGHDFFAAPTVSADGSRLAYLAWDHPDMPWDAARLFVADLGASVSNVRAVAGGHIADGATSAFQPVWLDDRLLFVVDHAGYWNLHVADAAGVRCLCADAAEYAKPLWALGSRTFAVTAVGSALCQRVEDGNASLVDVNIRTGTRRTIATEFCGFRQLTASADGHFVSFIGERATASPKVVRIDTADRVEDQLKRDEAAPLPVAFVSNAQPMRFPTAGGARAHALFYPPCNPQWRGQTGTLPPVLVTTHGGPTGSASRSLSLRTQYYTSRGFAVVDVDYRGSSGYGRAYRESLNGAWGLADVADAIAAVDHLVAAGLVDGQRAAIRGGSAGGFTTLAALTFSSRFRAGASHYGIGDLELLARDTHKFEARYLDRLVGPLPEAADIYRQRSPTHHIERINCPVLFLQGLEDRVVPPNQTEQMVAALDARGVPVACILFAEEGHGFRRSENIVRALEAEYAFFARVFGFTPAEPLPEVAIRNFR